MFDKYRLFLRWWLFTTFTMVGAIFSWYLGLFNELYNQDSTKLSFAIIAILITMSAWCGIKTFRLSVMPKKISNNSEYYFASKRLEDLAEIGWFSSDLCLTIGMIGTVVGFIIMLSIGFSQIDTSNPATFQSALTDIGAGMSTALYTTLVGLVASALLKVQYFNLSHGLKEVIVDEDISCTHSVR